MYVSMYLWLVCVYLYTTEYKEIIIKWFPTCNSRSGLADTIHSQQKTALSSDFLVNSCAGDQHMFLSSFLSSSTKRQN